MHKLMCTFATPMKKKIPDRNLDTSCPAGIPCKKRRSNHFVEWMLKRNWESTSQKDLRFDCQFLLKGFPLGKLFACFLSAFW